MLKAFFQASVCVLFACATAQALPPVKKNAKTIAAAPYLQVKQAYQRVLQDLVTCLATVQDKDSADAAVASVHTLNERLITLRKEEQNLPPAPKSIRAYILQQGDNEQNKEIAESGVGKALDLMMMQDAPCYGSTALQQALDELFKTLCGAVL